MKTLPLILATIGLCIATQADEKASAPSLPSNLIDTKLPDGVVLSGDVAAGELGDRQKEINGSGIRFITADDINKDGQHEGSVTTTVKNLRPEGGRWFRLRIQGMAQDGFQLENGDLYLKVEFFRDHGTNALDHIKQSIFGLVERDRKDMADAGTNKNLGHATWRYFDLQFRTPFPEVDTLKLSVGFSKGKAAGPLSEFWINDIALNPIPVPADYTPPPGQPAHLGKAPVAKMVPLGGRWYFDPRGGDGTPPTEFSEANADRLYYLTDCLETPFVGNMTSWLRKGYLDAAGQLVTADRYVPDNLIVSFTKTHLVMKSKCLPNHPTAVFPDQGRFLDGDPNYIQERLTTTNIPLEPTENPQHIAMREATNNNHALPGGPIGIAVNGIVFFNPFDHLLDADAVWRLDRCCGHPSPRALYHYHKYPVCVKSPWADNGSGHSPLIGFACDGYPVFGPYESAGHLAKDNTANPLNEFNIHQDPERGWHYHVTPGKFPHIIGGYWGIAEERKSPPTGARRR